MPQVIIHKKSGVADKVPLVADLTNGEIAINYTDRKAYGTDGSVVFEIGANIATQRVTTLLTVGNSTINVVANSTSVVIGANVLLNTVQLQIGNTTANLFANSLQLRVSNSTASSNLNPGILNLGANIILSTVSLSVGNTTANLFANSIQLRVANSTASSNLNPGIINLGANVILSTISLSIGNSTVNAFANSLQWRVSNSTGVSNVNPGVINLGANVVLSQTGWSVGNSTINAVSNSTDITLNSVSIVPFGVHHAWIPAYSMIPRTTNGPQSNTIETTTNKVMWKTLNFDPTVNEHAQFWISFPKSYNNGTVSAQFYWSHANTTTNFGSTWSIQAVAFSDDDGMDSTGFGTEVQIADTGGTNNDVYITANTPVMTIAGTPAANDMICFQVKRLPADAGDTATVDCRLHGVKLWYTTNAARDN